MPPENRLIAQSLHLLVPLSQALEGDSFENGIIFTFVPLG